MHPCVCAAILREFAANMGQTRVLHNAGMMIALLGLFFAPAVLAKDADSPAVKSAPLPVYLEADQLIDDKENDQYIAKGHVEARYNGRILNTDTLYYHPATKRIHAIGNIVVVDPDGTVQFADEMELSDDLADGVALAFFARLSNSATIGATSATHSENGQRNTLTKAFYTACKACSQTEDGKSKRPTWRIRARNVVQDQKSHMIKYRDAVLEVKGIPVFYSPYFAHPDPNSGRRSGLLFPLVKHSGKYGFSYEQPYYQVLGPYADATFTTRLFTGVNPLENVNYRQNVRSGSFYLNGSITKEQDFDGNGKKFGKNHVRGHIFGAGEFNLSEKWKWGFGAAGVTDDLYLRRYDIAGETDQRGIYSSNSQRLSNQLYAQGQSRNFFAQIGAVRFQGLRAGDVDDQFPIVGPLSDIRQRLDDPLFGGTLMLRANTVALTRIDGNDNARASLSLDWSRRLVAKNGIVLRPFAQGRTDIYQIHNPDFFADLGTNNKSVARALGVVGADLRWAFFRPGKTINWTVEPLAQIAASPRGSGGGHYNSFSKDPSGNTVITQKSIIPNEDSIAVEFDENSLFSVNRFNGYDRWEDGLRANLGGKVTARWRGQGHASLIAGQTFRDKQATQFSAVSGLRAKTSDYVTGAVFSPGPFLLLKSTARFDKKDFKVNRYEVDAAINLDKKNLGPLGRVFYSLSGSANYQNFDDSIASGRPTEEIRAGGALGLTRHWSISGSIIRDLDAGKTRSTGFGLVYADHCSKLELTYTKNNTTVRTLTPNTSIGIRFTLTTLGSFGSN